jgi:hypothetical protein
LNLSGQFGERFPELRGGVRDHNLAVPFPYPLQRCRRCSVLNRWPLDHSKTDFDLPVKALSKIFKAKFRDGMIKARSRGLQSAPMYLA